MSSLSSTLRNSKMPGSSRPELLDPSRGLSFLSIACPDLLRKQLALSLEGNNFPVLLVGEEGAGKRYVALRLAAALLCDKPDPQEGACGRCPSCKTLAGGAHHDLLVLEPEAGKSSIAVAAVRSMVSATLDIYPQLSRNRVYLISAAKQDSLTELGQNALLKPLEAHPEFVRFILLTEDDTRLLPTLVSRSRMIRLGRREEEDIRTILEEAGFEGDRFELAIKYADGLPGQAIALAGDEGFRDLRDKTLALFLKLPKATRTYCLTEGLRFFQENKKQTAVILRILESLLRDLLLLQSGLPAASLVNRDWAGQLAALSGQSPPADPAGASGLVRQTARALSSNANFDHTLARLLLGLRAWLGGLDGGKQVFQAQDQFS